MSHFAVTTAAWLFGSTIASAALVGAVLAALFLTLLAIYPLLSFLGHGWKAKQKDVFSSFSEDAKRCYLHTFLKKAHIPHPDKAFEEFYAKRYGRLRFILPALLFILVCFVLMLLFSQTAVSELIVCQGKACNPVERFAQQAYFLVTLPPVAAASIVGAYLWVVAGFITSVRRYNLHASDILNGTLRLAVSAAIGYALSSFMKDSTATFIAFAVGAFPLATVNVILRRLARKQLGQEQAEAERPDNVTKLDGVDPSTADLLYETGILTIPQLAYFDPVQLSMRTGLAFDFISDLCAQALARIYLGDKLDILRCCGLRSSIEIKNMYDAVKDGDADAAATLAAAAKLVSLDIASFANACDEIAGDPYTIFLHKLWCTTLKEDAA